MKSDQDIAVNKYKDMVAKMRNLFSEMGQAIAFFEPELMEMGEEKLASFVNENDELKEYEHYLDDIMRMKAHTLSTEMENLMALSGPMRSTAGNVYSMMNNVDFVFPEMKDEKGETVRITHGRYGKFMQSPDRRVRKDVYLGIHSVYQDFKNTLAANYTGVINAQIFNSKARNYKTTREAALKGNAVPEEIYDNLIKSVNDNLEPLHRYVSLRKRLLKLEDGVHDYDLRTSMFVKKESNYTWEEAMELVSKGVAPMGDEYIEIMTDGMKNGWVDVYESKGKRSGAYSSSAYGVHPYVLMNYNESLDDVFTLAHEMGHAMHTYYSMKEQPYQYADYPIFLAEVASTTNEALLTDYLLKNAKSDEEKISLIDNMLTGFARTYYRQVIFAEFEYRSHQMAENNEPLNPEVLENLFGEIYAKYQGPDFILDDATKAMWSRIPHFYYNYYVFQYSTSFAASQAIAKKILEEGDSAREDFFKMLKGGSHMYPVELLKEAGVDLSTPKPFEDTAAMMNKYLDILEELLED
jgi:oligoendopeptidase F